MPFPNIYPCYSARRLTVTCKKNCWVVRVIFKACCTVNGHGVGKFLWPIHEEV